MNTKDRILDAAERLFARDGFEATSLRAITAEAQVNLAAVNYHFQSKDALVQAVIGRRMGPLNQIMDPFLRPIVELVGSHAHQFVPLIGRLYTEPGDFVARLYEQQFEHMRQRFFPVLERALPDLPRAELAWRIHFAIGAMAHTMAASKILELMSGGEADISDVRGTLARLKAFIIAGLTAPVSAPASSEVHHAAH